MLTQAAAEQLQQSGGQTPETRVEEEEEPLRCLLNSQVRRLASCDCVSEIVRRDEAGCDVARKHCEEQLNNLSRGRGSGNGRRLCNG